METALRARLLADATVAAIVGTRVDWDVRPQGDALPALVLETVNGTRSQHHSGFDTFQPTDVQFNCFAGSKKIAVDLREAVIAAITPAANAGGTAFLRAQNVETRQRPDNVSTGIIYREIVEATIWHD